MSGRLPSPVIADLTSWLGAGFQVVGFGSGYDGAVAVAAIPASTTTQSLYPPLARVVRWAGGVIRTVELPAPELVPYHIQTTDEHVLIADVRGHRRREGTVGNGAFYDWSGRLLRRIELGHGVAHVGLTSHGEVWVGYNDEGASGGRQLATVPTGLVCLDNQGGVRFAYDDVAAGTGPIFDACAMYIGALGEAWVYFDNMYPIVRFDGKNYRSWRYGVPGARALLVREDTAVLVGNGADASSAVVLHLGQTEDASIVRRMILVNDADAPLKAARVVTGGSDIYLLDGLLLRRAVV